MVHSPDALPAPEHREVLDALQDPVIASDEEGRIVYANAAAERLLGWSGRELVGQPLTMLMPPRFRDAHEAGFRRFVGTRRPKILGRPVRVPALHRGGEELDIELTLSAVERPGPMSIIAVLRDLRARVELEQTVASQRKILAQYAAVGVLAGATSADEALPKVLAGTAEALGFEVGLYWAFDPGSDRLQLGASWSADGGEGFVDRVRGASFARGEGLAGRVLASGQAAWTEEADADPLRGALLFPVRGSSRTFGVLEYRSRAREEPDEALLQTMTAVAFQIGQFLERLSAEDRLRAALAAAQADRDNLHRLFNTAPAAIAIVRGAEFHYELSNPMNQLLAGGRQLVGKTVREALPELEAAGTGAVVRRVYETGEPFVANEFPVTLPEAEGRPARPIFMNGVVQPLRDGSGAIDGAMIFAYDVTDLVTSRERVRETEERLRLALDAADIGIFDFDPQARTIRCDERYKALFGIPKDAEVTSELLGSAIHPDDAERVQAAVAASLDPATGGEFDIDYRIRGISDAIERWGHMRGRTFFDPQGKPLRFIGTGIDITAQRRALERLRFLAEASTILARSLDYRVTLDEVARLAVAAMADWCVVEVLNEAGLTEQVAVAHRDPDKVELARELRRRYPPDPRSPSGVARVVATGSPMFVPEISDEMLVAGARDEEHLRVLRTLGLRSSVMLPLNIRGKTIGVLALMHAESGRRYTPEDVEFAGEIARRAAAAIENARLYDQAMKAIAMRDQFLSIASHELKTPLTSLTLQLSTLNRMAGSNRLAKLGQDKLEQRLALMARQATRLGQLIDELLDVTRLSSGRLSLDLAPTDLVAVVREVVAGMAERAASQRVTFSLAGVPRLEGRWDAHRLEQVVVNLLENAIKYGGSDRTVHLQVADGVGRAVLRVRDEGPGIAPEDQARIFDQFERAAPTSLGGLGLGLWIVRKLVDAHAGVVRVESRPGVGSTFVVELPMEGPSTP